jgi:hypothetical protein
MVTCIAPAFVVAAGDDDSNRKVCGVAHFTFAPVELLAWACSSFECVQDCLRWRWHAMCAWCQLGWLLPACQFGCSVAKLAAGCTRGCTRECKLLVSTYYLVYCLVFISTPGAKESVSCTGHQLCDRDAINCNARRQRYESIIRSSVGAASSHYMSHSTCHAGCHQPCPAAAAASGLRTGLCSLQLR